MTQVIMLIMKDKKTELEKSQITAIQKAKLSVITGQSFGDALKNSDVVIFGDNEHKAESVLIISAILAENLGIKSFGFEAGVDTPVWEEYQDLVSDFAKDVRLFNYDMRDTVSRIDNPFKLVQKQSLKVAFTPDGPIKDIERINLTQASRLADPEIKKNSLHLAIRVNSIVHDEMAFNLVEKWEEITAKGEKKMALIVGGSHLDVDDISLDKILAKKMAEKGHHPKIAVLNVVPIRDIKDYIIAETPESERSDGRSNLTFFVPDTEQGKSIHEFNVKGIDPSLIIPPPEPEIEAGKVKNGVEHKAGVTK